MNRYINKQNLNNSNTTIIIEKKIHHYSKRINIKKIYCNNTNKELLLHIFTKELNLKKNEIKSIERIKQVKKFLYLIKKSGFFSYIKVIRSKNNLNNFTSFIIKLYFNPIIKQIHILNCSNLQIPSIFLKQNFKHHIGLPKNYSKLQKSIKKIHKWYIAHGFKFVSIKLIENDLQSNILISIDEGIIGQIEVLSNTNTLYHNKIRANIYKLIQTELNLQTGQPLNIKKLELYLMYLKKQKIFNECYYNIHLSNGLINLKLYCDTIYVPKINLYIKDYKLHNKAIIFNHIYKIIKRNSNNHGLSTSKVIKDFYLVIEQMHKHLIFEYYFLYQHIYKYYLQIKTKIYRHKYQISIYIGKSINLSIIKCKAFHLLMLKLEYLFYNCIIPHPLIYIECQQKYYSNINQLKSELNQLNIFFNYKLTENMQFNKIINIINLINNHSNISINYLFLQQVKKTIANLNTIAIKLKKYCQSLQYRLIYIELSIQFNSLYLMEFMTTGKLLIIHSKLIGSILHNGSFKYLGQIINGKYIQYCDIPIILPKIHKNIVIFLIDIQYFIQHVLFLPIYLHNYCTVNYNKINNRKQIIQHYESLIKVEFHIYKWKYISTYIFYYFYNDNYMHNTDSNILKSSISRINLVNKGIGIQLNIPIKNLANIKIKYHKKNQNKSYLIIKSELKHSTNE